MILTRWLLSVTPAAGEVEPTAPGPIQTAGSNEVGQIGDETTIDRGNFTTIGALSWKSVAVGASHVMALRSDNLLYGWGSNKFGQLGDSSIINRSSPVQIGTSSWNYISSKKDSTFGITADNKLFAWGFSYNGELGNNQRFDYESWSDVSIGSSHGLAIRSSDSSLWSWGRNVSGQLGNGSTVDNPYLTKIGDDSWLMVSAGAGRSFGIKTNYTLWGWGGIYLGDGVTVGRSSPVQIGSSSWTMVDAGIENTAGGITTNGELYMWGANFWGNIGDGTTTTRTSTTKIGALSWIALSVGESHTAAIRNDYKLFTWGTNSVGRLGLNQAITIHRSSPVQVGTSSWVAVGVGDSVSVAIRSDNTLWQWGGIFMGDNTGVTKSSPVQIGTSSWTKVSTGYNTTHAVRLDNTLWGWGRNTGGTIGDNSTINRSSPVQIGSSTWSKIARPNSTALGGVPAPAAGVTVAGGLYVWGNNNNQLMFTDTNVLNSSPVQVGLAGFNSPILIGSSSWNSVSAGTSRTYAIRSDGGLFAWGANELGRLGDNTEVYRSSPVQIGSSSWHSVSAGDKHAIGIDSTRKLHFLGGSVGANEDGLGLSWSSIAISREVGEAGSTLLYSYAAIRSDGALFTWGGNDRGQLGDGTTIFKSYPVQLGSSSWSLVAAGERHMLGIRSDGGLFVWGDNSTGQLGTNSPIASHLSSPVQLGTDSWSQVSAYRTSSYAIRNDGGLFTWGSGANGMLGTNNTLTRSSPVQVGSSSWVSVSAGQSWAAGKLSNGTIYAWGLGSTGTLGNNTTLSRSSPTQIGTSSWVTISAGRRHGIAMNSSGVLFGWGSGNPFGDSVNRSAPTQLFAGSHTFVTAGDDNTFAIYKSGATYDYKAENNNVVAAGPNSSGIFGRGDTTSFVAGFHETNDIRWRSITASANVTAGITATDGALYLWGRGQPEPVVFTLGSLDARSSLIPIQVLYTETSSKLISSSSWNFISAGYNHNLAINSANNLYGWGNHSANTNKTDYSWISATTTRPSGSITYYRPAFLAIRSDGALFAWGTNDYGVLGDNTAGATAARSSPIQIGSSSWSMVSSSIGGVYAIRSDGVLFAWGFNNNGMLGDNSTINRSSPVQISSSSWSFIADSAINSMAAITSDNRLFVWGNNGSGILGNNSTINRSSPVQIGTSFISASISVSHLVALRQDGSIWSSGVNTFGQLGTGTTFAARSTLTVLDSNSWAAVSAGGGHTLAIRSDGTLYAWGLNRDGELGDGTTVSKSSPIQIGTSSWTFVHAARSDPASNAWSFGVTTDGVLYAWGNNNAGRLGDGTRINRSSPVLVNGGVNVANKSWIMVDTFGYFVSDMLAVSFALRSDNRLFVWGTHIAQPSTSSYGEYSWVSVSKPVQVGLPSRDDFRSYTVSVPSQIGSDSWRVVSAGNNSSFAINSANNLYAWGSGANDLGTGSVYEASPVLIGGASNKVGAVDTTESVTAIAKLS